MELVLFTIVMVIAMTLSGIIGFAGNIIALPMLSMFMDLKIAVAILLLITFVQATLQMIQLRKLVIWKDVCMISFYMLLLVPFGFIALHYLSEFIMKGFLGFFIFITAIKNMRRSKQRVQPYTERPWHKLYLVIAGLLTGAFGCGGPLMVIYCRNRYLERDQFRAMQFSAGSIVMGVSCLGNLWTDVYTIEIVPYLCFGLLAVSAAIYVSTKLVRKMDTDFFQKVVNLALLVSALMLLTQAGKGLIGS